MVSDKGSGDGRRHNSPPEHGKIKRGEVRNRWGRSGKPTDSPPTSMHELLWKEAARVVGEDADGPVDIKRRLIQKELIQALRTDDQGAMTRVQKRLYEASERIDQQARADLLWVLERKAELKDRFEVAEARGLPPPDIIPHPDHVIVEGQSVRISGPTDRKMRENWEWLKAAIRVAAYNHAEAREEYGKNGGPEALARLREVEAHRRKLMRKVPKGWDWREEIYSCDSLLALVQEGFAKLEAHRIAKRRR